MFTRFMSWLEEEANGFAVVGYVFVAALVVMSIQQSIDAAMMNWGLIPQLSKQSTMNPFDSSLWKIELVETLALAPLLEEPTFRLLPLAFIIAFVSRSPKVVFGFTIAFALLFGAIHPYGLTGKVNVAIAGLLFGFVFLKCGGLQKRFVKATLCAMAVHSLTNLFALTHEWWVYQIFNS